eukprot:gene25262-27347_t
MRASVPFGGRRPRPAPLSRSSSPGSPLCLRVSWGACSVGAGRFVAEVSGLSHPNLLDTREVTSPPGFFKASPPDPEFFQPSSGLASVRDSLVAVSKNLPNVIAALALLKESLASIRDSGYKRYDFEVREGDRVRHRVERVALPNMAEAWAIVGDLSRRFDRPGNRIMVRDENGGVLIYPFCHQSQWRRVRRRLFASAKAQARQTKPDKRIPDAISTDTVIRAPEDVGGAMTGRVALGG